MSFNRSIAAAVLLLVLAPMAQGVTYYVDASIGNDEWDGLSPVHIMAGMGPVRSIGAAVQKAHSPGDIIIVADGVYQIDQNLPYEMEYKNLTLESANGPENCVIDCTSLDQPIHFPGQAPPSENQLPPATLAGFTIVNPSPIALYFTYEADAVIKNCVIRPAASLETEGAILCTDNASPRIVGCRFDGFETGYYPSSVIMCRATSSPVIENCLFSNNVLKNQPSGVIFCTDGSTPLIKGCEIVNTTGNHIANGVHCEGQAVVTIRDCLITQLSALSEAAGIRCQQDAEVIVSNCTLSLVESNQFGAGLSLNENAKATVTDSIITGNTPNGGGGVSLWGNVRLSMERCTISHNRVSGAGGGLQLGLNTGETYISNCLIVHNQAGSGGGAIIHADFTGIIKNCTIANNTAMDQGGGIFNQSSNANIRNSIIRDNWPVSVAGSLEETHISYCNIDFENMDPAMGEVWAGIVSEDPLFAKPGEDYHLKSEAGRYDPDSGRWVTDETSSPCIDTGDPGDFVGDEPLSSGGRINMGAYGGTAEASRTDICTGPLPGDANKDCRIDLADLALIAGGWLQSTLVDANTY